MARKKVVFVIVEGPSDDTALSVILSRYYQPDKVYVDILYRDITTEKGVNSANIISKLGNEIRQYLKVNSFIRRSDILQIIHLVDMDGVYISDANVLEDLKQNKTLYSDREILTNNPPGIRQRNLQKRAVLDRLCKHHDILKIPYRIFYMSCNLDHALYGKRNSSDKEKESDAVAFAQRYKDDIPGFLSFIAASDFSVVTSYDASWQYIKEGTHSLERHTNLGLCFALDKVSG